MSIFELPKLPYAYNALEPHIDARTMEIHHGKHHNGYVNNLNVNWAEEGSSVMNLTLTAKVPQKEIRFLNKLIELYSFNDLQSKREAALRSLNFIEKQL